uniref:Variant surface glycoprotein n=1 Tax=Trypanosoma brucei rhodesiense TaxID=31286 RepID=C6YXI5_TRYBR|nr:variant surface glycoprotein [Trypanosoma brucei rhodesiense]
MQDKRRLTRQIGVIIFLAAAQISQADDNKPVTHMTGPCGAAFVLSEISKELTTKINAADAGMAAIREKLTKSAVALTQSKDLKLAKMAGSVLIVLAKKYEEILTNQQALKGPLVTAIRSTANISGYQYAIGMLEGLKVKGQTMGHADPSSASAGNSNINFMTKTAGELKTCRGGLNGKANSRSSWINQANLERLKIYELQPIDENKASVRLPLAGKVSSANCGKSGQTDPTVTTSGDHSCIAGGPVFQRKDKEINKGGTEDYGLSGSEIKDPMDFEQYAKLTAIQLLKASRLVANAKTAFDVDRISSYAADDYFKAAVGAAFGNLDREAAIGDKASVVNTLIEKHYGTDTTFKSKYWGEIEKISLPSKSVGEKSTDKVQTVSTLSTAAKVMLQGVIDSEKRQDTTKTVGEDRSESESKAGEKCKDKPQGECKEENGCEFKEGKCQDKVTKAATDGKTNTTASNSFVINKGPLLLAVLLF